MRMILLQALNVEPSFMVRMKIIKALSAFRDDEEAIEAISAALTDTNHETTINGLCVRNSWVAQQAIVMIRSPEQPSHLDWPE